jgi:hypothetical protein
MAKAKDIEINIELKTAIKREDVIYALDQSHYHMDSETIRWRECADDARKAAQRQLDSGNIVAALSQAASADKADAAAAAYSMARASIETAAHHLGLSVKDFPHKVQS